MADKPTSPFAGLDKALLRSTKQLPPAAPRETPQQRPAKPQKNATTTPRYHDTTVSTMQPRNQDTVALTGLGRLADGFLEHLPPDVRVQAPPISGRDHPALRPGRRCINRAGRLADGFLERLPPDVRVQTPPVSGRDHPALRPLVLPRRHQLPGPRGNDGRARRPGRLSSPAPQHRACLPWYPCPNNVLGPSESL